MHFVKYVFIYTDAYMCIYSCINCFTENIDFHQCYLHHSEMTDINFLRAKFFRGNLNIYLHFVSFLHIDMTQVL